MDEWHGMSQVIAAAVALGVAIAVGFVLLEFLRWLFGVFGSDFFEKFPCSRSRSSAGSSFNSAPFATASVGR